MVKRVGPYELKSEIGSGTFGRVYVGRHTSTNNKIAVKVISKKSLKPELQIRLEQEIMCQRSVSSEFIVKLIDVQKTENNFYLVLEYCEGGDLGSFIKRKGSVIESVAQRWIQQIIEGFKALTKKNIIHRDLKLQNILMTEATTDAVLKLADFGLSRFLEDDLANTWVGTPLYMAPEIVNCQHYDAKADIWSLGLVLHELLTGELPFKVARRDQIPNAQKHLKPFPDNISIECRDLLMKMLEYDPKQRISFAELFVHPFIAVPGVKVEEPVAEEEFSDFEEDFVILEKDESVHEARILTIDSHPMINLNKIVEGLAKDVNLCRLLEKIGEQLCESNAVVAGLAVLIRSASVARAKALYCKEIAEQYDLQYNGFPKFHEKYESLKKAFRKVLSKAEQISAEIREEQDQGNKGLNVESLLMNVAIDFGKKGAKFEYLTDYETSKNKYTESVILLRYLSEFCEEKCQDSAKNLRKYLEDTEKRLESVKLKLSM